MDLMRAGEDVRTPTPPRCRGVEIVRTVLLCAALSVLFGAGYSRPEQLAAAATATGVRSNPGAMPIESTRPLPKRNTPESADHEMFGAAALISPYLARRPENVSPIGHSVSCGALVGTAVIHLLRGLPADDDV